MPSGHLDGIVHREPSLDAAAPAAAKLTIVSHWLTPRRAAASHHHHLLAVALSYAQATSRDIRVLAPGILDTVAGVAMTLRLSDEDTARLRQRAAADGVSMQRPALSAIQAYLDARERDELVGAGVEYALDRYPDALRRLGE